MQLVHGHFFSSDWVNYFLMSRPNTQHNTIACYKVPDQIRSLNFGLCHSLFKVTQVYLKRLIFMLYISNTTGFHSALEKKNSIKSMYIMYISDKFLSAFLFPVKV